MVCSSSAWIEHSTAGTLKSRSTSSDSPYSNRANFVAERFPGASIARPRQSGSSDGSFVTSSTIRSSFGRDEVDEKALAGLRGVVKISHTTVNGLSLTNLDGFAPASQWEELSTERCAKAWLRGGMMTYSYTQISQYLTCPRRYRHRYLDGWKEKDTRAAMLFGRAFEQALAAFFRREDPATTFFREWSAYQGTRSSVFP